MNHLLTVWSWNYLEAPLYFIKSKLFLISAMISSFFLSSTLNSRNFSVTLIQFNFSVKISTGQIQKWDSWTSPEMIKPVVASSESSFFLIITSSFGFWTVMFYLIEYQFSICIGNSLQVCFLRSLSGLGEPNFKAWTIFFHFQNAGRQNAMGDHHDNLIFK